MTRAGVRARPAAAALPHAAWVDDLPVGAVYGSLYAAPEAERDEVADRFALAELPIHLDVIIEVAPSGHVTHRGITPAQLLALGSRLPDALLEVHLIVLGDAGGGSRSALDGAVAEVLHVARRIGAQCVALPRAWADDPELTAAFREAGGAVWLVIEPGDDAAEMALVAETEAQSQISGALIMLIAPGTREAARPELLDRLAQLGPGLRAAVDGGVDAAIAARAFALGAHHVIVGRALLGPAHHEAASAAVRGEQS